MTDATCLLAKTAPKLKATVGSAFIAKAQETYKSMYGEQISPLLATLFKQICAVMDRFFL